MAPQRTFSPEEIKKAKEERRIFRIFAKVVPYGIKPRSIRSQWDAGAADIVCRVASGERVVFELGNVLDAKLARMVGNALSTKEYLQASLDVAPFKKTFEEMFSNASINIRFREEASIQQRRNAANQILSCLMTLGPDAVGPFVPRDRDLTKVVMVMHIWRGAFEGPDFEAPAGGGIGDPALYMLESKFGKNYATQLPMELLLYYDIWQPRPIPSIWEPAVSRFVAEGLETSSFRRVWVFSCVSEQVLYVYPPI